MSALLLNKTGAQFSRDMFGAVSCKAFGVGGAAVVTVKTSDGAEFVLHIDENAYATHTEIVRTTPPLGFDRESQFAAWDATFTDAAEALDAWNETREGVELLEGAEA